MCHRIPALLTQIASSGARRRIATVCGDSEQRDGSERGGFPHAIREVLGEHGGDAEDREQDREHAIDDEAG